MREWKFEDCIVKERNLDGSLLEFEVYNLDGFVVSIVMPDEDDEEECIRQLNEGVSPIGLWEDGKGKTVSLFNNEFEEYDDEIIQENIENGCLLVLVEETVGDYVACLLEKDKKEWKIYIKDKELAFKINCKEWIEDHKEETANFLKEADKNAMITYENIDVVFNKELYNQYSFPLMVITSTQLYPKDSLLIGEFHYEDMECEDMIPNTTLDKGSIYEEWIKENLGELRLEKIKKAYKEAKAKQRYFIDNYTFARFIENDINEEWLSYSELMSMIEDFVKKHIETISIDPYNELIDDFLENVLE